MTYTTAEAIAEAMREVETAMDVLREKRDRLERLLTLVGDGATTPTPRPTAANKRTPHCWRSANHT